MTDPDAQPQGAPQAGAEYMALMGGAVSPEANSLVDHLLDHLILPRLIDKAEQNGAQSPRPTSTPKLRRAAEAVLADLFELEAEAAPDQAVAAGWHGLSKSDFPAWQLGFALDIFKDATEPMIASGLLERSLGAPNWKRGFEEAVNVGGTATTYRLTSDFKEAAGDLGVAISDWSTHWRRTPEITVRASPRTSRLVLRKKKERVHGEKQAAQDCLYDPQDPQAKSILSGIERLNGYLGEQKIEGVAFPGLRRIFNNGDQPGFAWDKGGRYYSLPGGHFYEGWSAEKRRTNIRINGEAVEEADLRASHLTLYHALLRQPFDASEDPYAVGEWPRVVVKAWVSQALGASNPRPTQWSKRSQEMYEEERPGQWMADEFPIRHVGAEMTTRHPLLIDLGVAGITALDLQYHEAEILRLAMEDLMLKQDIAVLPIHDAIIAPRSKVEAAREAIVRAFRSHAEAVTGQPYLVRPKVTIKEPNA